MLSYKLLGDLLVTESIDIKQYFKIIANVCGENCLLFNCYYFVKYEKETKNSGC